MATIYRRVIDDLAELDRVVSSLRKSPVRDDGGRALRLTVERLTPTRSVEQNGLMWVLLTAISKQCQWPVNGQLVWLEPEDWKVILTAGLTKNQRVAQGVEGGFVLLGSSTSALDKQAMSELIDFLYFFGASHGVDFGKDSRPAEQHPPAANDALPTHAAQGEAA